MSSKSHEEFSPSGLPTGVYSIGCFHDQSINKAKKTWNTKQSVFCHWRKILGVQFDTFGTLCADCVDGCQWCNFSCTAGSNPLAVSCDGHGVHLDVLAEEHNLRVAARVADNLRVAASKQAVFWHWRNIRPGVHLHDVLAVERELCTRTKKSVFCHWRMILSCDVIL